MWWKNTASMALHTKGMREGMKASMAYDKFFTPRTPHNNDNRKINQAVRQRAQAHKLWRHTFRSLAMPGVFNDETAGLKKRKQLEDVVRNLYDTLQSIARFAGYNRFEAMLLESLHELLTAVADKNSRGLATTIQNVVARITATQAASHCAGLRPIAASAVGTVAQQVLSAFYGCDMPFIAEHAREYARDIAQGTARSVWTTVGKLLENLGSDVLPAVFQYWLFSKLDTMTEGINSFNTKLIIYNKMVAALERHGNVLGQFMMGAPVSLLPILIDVANGLDTCTLQAIILDALGINKPLPRHCQHVRRKMPKIEQELLRLRKATRRVEETIAEMHMRNSRSGIQHERIPHSPFVSQTSLQRIPAIHHPLMPAPSTNNRHRNDFMPAQLPRSQRMSRQMSSPQMSQQMSQRMSQQMSQRMSRQMSQRMSRQMSGRNR
jgi:hypothetical protein